MAMAKKQKKQLEKTWQKNKKSVRNKMKSRGPEDDDVTEAEEQEGTQKKRRMRENAAMSSLHCGSFAQA